MPNLQTVKADTLNFYERKGRTLCGEHLHTPCASKRGRTRGESDEQPGETPQKKKRNLERRFQCAPSVRNENMEEDTLGEASAEKLAEHNLTTMNDGKGTWFARRGGCRATSAPDLIIEAAAEAESTT